MQATAKFQVEWTREHRKGTQEAFLVPVQPTLNDDGMTDEEWERAVREYSGFEFANPSLVASGRGITKAHGIIVEVEDEVEPGDFMELTLRTIEPVPVLQ